MLPCEPVQAQSKCPVSLPWSMDDEESDPEMPDLVPCQVEKKTPPKLLRKKKLAFSMEVAQTNPEELLCAVGKSVEFNASTETQPSGAFQLAGQVGKLFRPRANALADALDSLQKSSEANKSVDGHVAVGSQLEGSSVSISSLESVERDADGDTFVECSAASERLLKRDRDELDMSFDAGDEDSSDENGDNETARGKRRRVDGQNDVVPPGAPSIAPAALAVAAAAATFPLESCGRRPPKVAENATLARRPKGVESIGNEKLVNDSSFGPRFRGLGASEIEKVKSKWSLHSLADVRTMSSDENRRAAAALLVDLRNRRTASSDSGEAAHAAEHDEGPCKPKFRKRTAVLGENPTQHTPAIDSKESRPLAGGGRMMQECLAGSGPRRRDAAANGKSLLACSEETIEPSDVSEPAFPKRSDISAAKGQAARAAKRVRCTSIDESDDPF